MPSNDYAEYDKPDSLTARRPWIAKILSSDQPRLNVLLFFLTCFSTFFIHFWPERDIAAGLWYSAGIMAILFCHEMGHYLMCVRYGIRATLPFFIPFPSFPFGTLGAVIRMDARMPTRRVLFDIGVAGPLAGLLVTLPAIYFGLAMSEVKNTADLQNAVKSVDPLLFKWIIELVKGPLPAGHDVLLHPLAYAGWAGLFVTALNLLPIGQLDGGHILYALLGERSQQIFPVTMASFALICIVVYPFWVLMILMLLWFGYRHPPTDYDAEPLDFKRQVVACMTFLIFAFSFTPVPFHFY